MKKRSILTTILAVWLSLAVALPPGYDRGSQALAAGSGAASSSRSQTLRTLNAGMEESPVHQALRETLNVSGPAPSGLEEKFQKGDRIRFDGRPGTVVSQDKDSIVITFDDRKGSAEPEERYNWRAVQNRVVQDSAELVSKPSDSPRNPTELLRELNRQLRAGKPDSWNAIVEMWTNLMRQYRSQPMEILRSDDLNLPEAVKLMVRIALEAPSDSTLEIDKDAVPPLVNRVQAEFNELFGGILTERRNDYLKEDAPALKKLRVDVIRWIHKAIRNEEKRLGREDPNERLKEGRGVIQQPFAAVWALQRLQEEFPNQEITAVAFPNRLLVSADGYNQSYPRLGNFGGNVLHTHAFEMKLKASPEDTETARALEKRGVGSFIVAFDLFQKSVQASLLVYDPNQDFPGTDPSEVNPWKAYSDYNKIQPILQKAGFVKNSSLDRAGLEETAAAARMFADQARKEGDVRIVLGPTAFQMPGLGAAVKALQEAGLKDRFIVLPGLPPDAPKDRLPDEVADQLFSLGVEVLSLTNPFLKGYADENDRVMQGFQDALRGFRVPFQRSVPSGLTLMVRQILLDLGVPEATATTEAVDRFLSLTGLEEAA